MIQCYDFLPAMAALVEAGVKAHTIRRQRADGREPMPGDTLRLFTGRRTKQCKLIAEFPCLEVTDIRILPGLNGRQAQVILGGGELSDYGLAVLARNDGFGSVEAFFRFFGQRYGMPFAGHLIAWDDNPRFRTYH